MTGFFKIILNGKSGNIYNIGNPYNEISMIRLVKIFDKLLNKKNDYKLIDYPKHYPADEPKRRCPDITQARIHTKYNPKISVTEGILRTLNYNNISAKK
jgi:UDP-glucuronate decarboxylase